ncbi:hypothetical protein B0H63DRAFT_19529 [Podospora didyma]|uniref:Transmembrane protein n=1 Tax=Podospora didyma TaxID=330526 RepID=A0AAE0P568_9PEZI|nr:hypothetical protein B0H63DRAFT_19529 [Podospora didyma]
MEIDDRDGTKRRNGTGWSLSSLVFGFWNGVFFSFLIGFLFHIALPGAKRFSVFCSWGDEWSCLHFFWVLVLFFLCDSNAESRGLIDGYLCMYIYKDNLCGVVRASR